MSACVPSPACQPATLTETERRPGLGVRFVALLRGIAREWALRRALREMSALSDVTLKDIGVSRAEIEGAVREGRRRPDLRRLEIR